MFGLKRLRYRRDVDADMSYLIGIGIHDAYLRKMLASFTGIKDVIREQFHQNKSPMDCAIFIWANIFTHEIERSSQLQSDASRIERFILHGEGAPRYDTEKMIKLFFYHADLQRSLGRADDYLIKYAVTEIVGALHGVPANERSAHRIVAPLMPSANSSAVSNG